MTTYYVDPVSGDDTHAGMAPGSAWRTMAKALGASGIASGDEVVVKGGSVIREIITLALTSPVAETKVTADLDGSRFRSAGDSAPTTGIARWTAYTTNDKTAPSSSALIGLAGRDFITWDGFVFEQGGGRIFDGVATTNPLNHKFNRCVFRASGAQAASVDVLNTAGTSLHWQFNKCIFFGISAGGSSMLTQIKGAKHTVDYDLDVVFNNCLFVGNFWAGVYATSTGSGSGLPGGVLARHCTFIGGLRGVRTDTMSTSIPCSAKYSMLVGQGAAALETTGTLGNLIEDWNFIAPGSGVARTLVSAGANSIASATNAAASYATLFHIGQERIAGAKQQTFGAPTIDSPLLGFVNDGGDTVVDDLFGFARPSGGKSANKSVGAMERPNTWVADSIGGYLGYSIVGPGVQEFEVAIPAGVSTLSLFMQYDATYAGTLPQFQVIGNGETGVSSAIATMTLAANTREQLTLAISAAVAGVVKVRFLSNDTNGGGKVFADTFNVT